MIVVDASALIDVLLRAPSAGAIEERLFFAGETLHAPHLIDIEIAHVLRRHAAARKIDEARGREALEDLSDFPLRRYPHGMYLPRIWELRTNISAYDAMYVALAEALDATLLTRDQRLASAPGHHARIELA